VLPAALARVDTGGAIAIAAVMLILLPRCAAEYNISISGLRRGLQETRNSRKN